MIDSRAIVDPSAELADDVEVGPFAIVGPQVRLGSGTVVGPHAVVKGPTDIGPNNRIFQFASIGEDCQDKKYSGEATWLEVGANNTFRECVTVHRGTAQDRGVTSIGDDNLLMSYSHVAHDCHLGNHNILSNNAQLAGHVQFGDHVVLSALAGIHQFCRVGSYAMIGGGSIVLKDVPAFVMVMGNTASAHGLNLEGLRRHGFDKTVIDALKNAYRTVYRQGLTLEKALASLEGEAEADAEVKRFVDSIRASRRGITR